MRDSLFFPAFSKSGAILLVPGLRDKAGFGEQAGKISRGATGKGVKPHIREFFSRDSWEPGLAEDPTNQGLSSNDR